jgi:hypothetical protein
VQKLLEGLESFVEGFKRAIRIEVRKRSAFGQSSNKERFVKKCSLTVTVMSQQQDKGVIIIVIQELQRTSFPRDVLENLLQKGKSNASVPKC